MHLLRISLISSHKAILNFLACPQQMVPKNNYVQLQLSVIEENLILKKNVKMSEKVEVMHGLTLLDKQVRLLLLSMCQPVSCRCLILKQILRKLEIDRSKALHNSCWGVFV